MQNFLPSNSKKKKEEILEQWPSNYFLHSHIPTLESGVCRGFFVSIQNYREQNKNQIDSKIAEKMKVLKDTLNSNSTNI